MKVTLQNSALVATVNAMGAELSSVLDKVSNREFMWQADPAFWGRHAPILFPFVGETAGGTVGYDHRSAPMQRHGFARTSLFQLIESTDSTCTFRLMEDEKTLQAYPFQFVFDLQYGLQNNRLVQYFKVTNTSRIKMGFQLGGHPAFALPLGAGETFIDMHTTNRVHRSLLNSGGLYTGSEREVETNNGRIHLANGLFDEDALVFKNQGLRTATLGCVGSTSSIKVEFDGFPMLGIWSVPNAPFVCIEPWFGCADRVNGTGKLWDKEGLITLSPNQNFEAAFTMHFNA